MVRVKVNIRFWCFCRVETFCRVLRILGEMDFMEHLLGPMTYRTCNTSHMTLLLS